MTGASVQVASSTSAEPPLRAGEAIASGAPDPRFQRRESVFACAQLRVARHLSGRVELPPYRRAWQHAPDGVAPADHRARHKRVTECHRVRPV